MKELLLDAPAPQPSPPAAQLWPASAQESLCLDNVTRFWGRGSSKWAVLREVNLELRQGTVNWIGGRNGVGKTTLLRIAAGILVPHAGVVTFEGISARYSRRDYARQLGFLSAGDRGLYARLSVRRHLEYVAALSLMSPGDQRAAAQATISSFGLEALATRRADRLSQGQRQRVRLGLAFVHQPRLVLLDEPRNSLDDEGMSLLINAVDEVTGRGGTVLWCSPSGEHQSLEFDAGYVLEDGMLRQV